MQMKTAMQELIQSLKAEQMIASNEWQMGYQKALSNVILEIESMLEKEKEQMIDFVLKWMGEDDLKQNVIKHYNETYKGQ